MAKNIALIPGERSNWEIAIFLLIDKMIPFIKPRSNFDRQDIVCEAGMSFVYDLLGSIGYSVNKALEESMQGRINNMVKKGYIIADYGRYTLTDKGYNRLYEIRKKYNPGEKEAIGARGKAIKAFKALPKELRDKIIRELEK